ncbi:MAG: hypothetical protein ACI9CA_001989 [Natronomonas sp.]|jgi:hypothetical protein
MSSSRHPVALSIEQQVGGSTRLLAVVMLLPLVDGIFPALVLAGALDSVAGILEVGLLVFGGSATVAVVLAEMDGSPVERARSVLFVGVALVALAVVEAALAPTLASLLDLVVFERFAAVVILAVAAATASARVGEYLPRPAVVVALGALASLDLAGATLAVQVDPELLVRAGAAAGVGVAVAAGTALASPVLQGLVDIDRFRFGSAVALGVLGLSVAGLVPSEAPLALAVLAVTALLALDPDERTVDRYRPDDVDLTTALSGSGADDGGDHDGGPVPETVAADSGGTDGDTDAVSTPESEVYGASTAAKLRREGNA